MALLLAQLHQHHHHRSADRQRIRSMTKIQEMEAADQDDEIGESSTIISPKRPCLHTSNTGEHDEYTSLIELQDADYSQQHVSPLFDEVELMIMARVPLPEHNKLRLLNKRYLSLVKSGELLKIRRELGAKHTCVFVVATGDENWWAFDRRFMSQKRLPELPAEDCFLRSDKETLCAGAHLIVSGIETTGPAIWRYELDSNEWFRGLSMNEPRCLFASASSGDCAFVAGGMSTASMNKRTVLSSAEKYSSETKKWEPLPDMEERRKFCSGIYMDGKFYVLGGENENGEALDCGEVFDEERNRWVKIPGMLRDCDLVSGSGGSPPLLAVANDNLYSIEARSNQLMGYLKESNSWRKLGPVPVVTEFNRGWGVAFKSLGDELVVMGGAGVALAADNGLAVYVCRAPDPKEGGELEWRLLNGAGRINRLSNFIRNCSVMSA